jgi:hypothetical protein
VLQGNIDACLHETPWRLLILVLLPVLAALNSCKGGGGGSSTTTTTPTNLVSCIPSQVTLNGKSVCTATITGLSSTTVGTWEVAGVAGGDATHGTIDNNGNYTAPATFPTANVITITALAQAQTSLTGSANVTILQPTVISSVTCQDSGTQTLTISSGRSLACIAIASGGSIIPAFWKVNGVTGGSAASGFMSAQGVYIAPLVPPTGGTVTITAVSQSDSTQTQTVTVAVTFGNAVLQGPYAFSTSGKFPAGGSFVRTGSFTADGNGRLSFGIEDINPPGGAATTSFTGLYSIGPDGRGTMQFCEHTPVACSSGPSGAANVNFRIVVLSPQQVQIIQFETGATASGEMISQNTAAFNTSGLSGTYTFSFSGVSSGTTTESAVGEFLADGDPGHTGTGNITSGELDTNAGGVISSQAAITGGTYTVGGSGRGTATIITASKTFTFNVYMVSAANAIFVEQDSAPVLVGDAFKQQFGGPWGASTLSANIVLGTAGSKSGGGGIADLVSFTASATSATDGTVTAAAIDENSAGTVTSSSSLSGTYSFTGGNGRGTLGISGHTYVFYMIAQAPAAAAVVQETTAGVVASGSMIQPQGGSSLQGSYAFASAGLVGTNEEDIVGQLSADGKGNITNTAANPSTLDINDFGALQAAQANTGSYGTTNGRTTMSLTSATTPSVTRNFVMYFVNPTAIFALGTDNTGPVTGSLDKQF